MKKVIEAIKRKLHINFINKIIKFVKLPIHYNTRETCNDLSAVKRFKGLYDKASLELFQRYMGRC